MHIPEPQRYLVDVTVVGHESIPVIAHSTQEALATAARTFERLLENEYPVSDLHWLTIEAEVLEEN